MTQKQRVLEALQSGNEMTAKQIASRFNVGNPRDVIRQIRLDGYAVYCNKKTNSKGEEKGFYRLGRPSRALIAAGYRALAAEQRVAV
jgi:hypothetical protein